MMHKRALLQVCDIAMTAAPLACFLIAWWAFTLNSPERQFFFSTPGRVFIEFYKGVGDGSLLRHSAVTAGTAFIGFVIGNLIGIGCGIALWYSPPVARISAPYLTVLGSFPVFSIAPMTILWWGTGVSAKIILAFLATFVLALGQAYHGASQSDAHLLARFRILGASRWIIFRHLLFPSALIWILRSLRLSIGASLLGVYVGELISSECGLAYMIARASGLYDTDRVIVGVVCFAVVAVTFDWLVSRIELRTRASNLHEPLTKVSP
jgi:NitT/TauT family transport system permease protein